MRGFLIFILLLLTCASAQAQAADIPYIYYYDFLHQRMVIERADGTDSRIIPDLLPEDHNTVRFGDVSPSGRWMVVNSHHTTGEAAAYSHTLQVFSLNGNTRLDLGTYSGADFTMRWSPVDDILLIAGIQRPENNLQIRLLDVDHAEDLAVFTLNEYWLESLGGIETYWSANGERVYIGNVWGTDVIVLHSNGQVEARLSEYASPEIRSIFHKGVLFDSRHESQTTISLILQDLEDGRQVTIEDQRERGYWSYRVLWNPQMSYALISARPCGDGSCEGWLRLVDWTAGTTVPISPPIWFTTEDGCDILWTCGDIWSADGNFALLTTLESDDRIGVYMLDAQAAQLISIPTTENLHHFQWLLDGTLVLMTGRTLIYYNPLTGQQSVVNLPDDLQLTNSFHSPDGMYIALSSVPAQVLDQAGHMILSLMQHSHSTGSYHDPHDYQWDAESGWGMANYVISFGSGYHPIASVVFDPISGFQRELPSGSDAGFLPSRAIPHLSEGQPTSYTFQPDFVLPFESDRPTVVWHPTDPNELVICCDESNYVFWSLADGQPQIISAGDLDAMPAWSRSENHDLPTLVSTSDGTRLQFPVSGREVVLDSADPLGNVLRLTSDLNVLLSGSVDTLYFADTETGRVVLLDGMSGITNPHSADAFGTLAAISSVYRSDVRLYSTLDGHLIDRFYSTADSLAFSADGMRLATTSAGKVSIWDVSAYRP